MSALHIAPTPFFSNRGCHIRIRNEIEALKSFKVRIILCTYHHGQSVSGIDIRRIFKIPGYTKTDVGYSSFKFIADFFLFFLALKTTWKERPVILHGHLHEGALLGWMIKRILFWRKIPLVMDMQGSLAGELEAYKTFQSFPFVLNIFSWIEQLICWLPDHFICSSENSQSLLENRFGISRSKIVVVRDVVPSIFFSRQNPDSWKKKYRIPKDKRVILYAGSLLPGKGIHHVLEAMRILSGEYEDLFFILAGYPKKDVESYVQMHGLKENSYLPGEIQYESLPAWLSTADIALEPKFNDSGEASGKLIHYMTAGLPIVCYDFPINRAILGDAGYFANPGSIHDFIHEIKKALADARMSQQKGAKSRARAEDNYSLKNAGIKLKMIYDALQ